MDTATQLVFEKTVVRSEKELVEQWLVQLDAALQSESRASVASLFAPDGHWRDLLAFTWSITPSQGAEDIAAVEFDRKTIDGLIARGFKFDAGEDGVGHQWKVRTRYGGYYLDAGCSQLIIDDEVGLLQYDQIERFVEGGALLKDGSVKPADLIVLATGFVPQEVVVAKLLGDEVAKKVGPVWGFGPDGEMSNMWKRTAQEGLWFVGGSFANCRTYSRYVALQIKAIAEGIAPKR